MGGRLGWTAATIGLLLLGAWGCGGDGSTSTATSASDQSRPYPWVTGPARGFLGPDGENATAAFGREASDAERAQAWRVIEAWMRARAAKAWAEDCSYFSRKYIQALVVEDAMKVSKGKVQNCPQALAYFGAQASGDYKNTLSGPIDSLRVQKSQGFALYHGREGHDWMIPMDRENGKWWVAIAAPIKGEG
jgi:hypothetical protein